MFLIYLFLHITPYIFRTYTLLLSHVFNKLQFCTKLCLTGVFTYQHSSNSSKLNQQLYKISYYRPKMSLQLTETDRNYFFDLFIPKWDWKFSILWRIFFLGWIESSGWDKSKIKFKWDRPSPNKALLFQLKIFEFLR